jgi:hypothetical protein
MVMPINKGGMVHQNVTKIVTLYAENVISGVRYLGVRCPLDTSEFSGIDNPLRRFPLQVIRRT